MRSISPLIALFAALAATPGAAIAQLTPVRTNIALSIRDGAELLSVRRDPDDPSRATAIGANGGVLRGRVDEHALVRVAPGTDAHALFRSLDVVPLREIAPSVGAWRVMDARGGDGLDLAVRLSAHAGPGRPLVDAIPDWIVAHQLRAISIPPDDPRYDGQWYLDRIGIEDAWALSTGDPSTTIVVIDSGCDGTHVDLVDHLDQGRDVIDGDDDPTPSSGSPGNAHGTSCAGLAAASTDNGEGIAGTCPECRLRCVRLLDEAVTSVPIGADVEAFQFALDVDAAVVSNSWGFVDPTMIPSTLRTVMETLVDTGRGGRGALVLFAAGNDDRELFDYEIEAVRGVINVGATNNFDEATSFSNHGDSVDVVAPTGTLTTDIMGPGGSDPGDYTSMFGGTSSSCPVAAGVAGLLASAAPESSGAELADALISTARPSPYATPDATGHDALYGYGRIQPGPALRMALGIPEPSPDGGTMDDAGAGTDAGADATMAGPDAGLAPDDDGCGCSTAATATSQAAPLFVALAILVFRSRRRLTRS